MRKSVISFRHLLLVLVFLGQDGVDDGGSLLIRDFAAGCDGKLVCKYSEVRKSFMRLPLFDFEELPVGMASFMLDDMPADSFESA